MVQLIYMGKPLTKTKWTDKERYYSYFLQDSQRATTSLVTLFKLSLINGLIEGKVTKFKRAISYSIYFVPVGASVVGSTISGAILPT